MTGIVYYLPAGHECCSAFGPLRHSRLNGKHLLKDDSYKDIIINSLRFLKDEGSVVIYGYVIMPNHIHLIWQIQDGYTQEKVQLRLMKFTAQQMKFKLQKEDPVALEQYRVNAKDRTYQFWERNPLSIDLWTSAVFDQKLDYIHNNPLQEKWRLAKHPEDYRYSSAGFYYKGCDEFGLLNAE